jgi:hypothetical protein
MKEQRRRLVFDLTVWITGPVLALSLLGVDVQAKSRRFGADNATWRAECGGCHVPYPPGLLPAADWRRLMGSLDRHFGADASVDPKAGAEIGAFLAANAGRGDTRAAEAEPRITTTRWFRHEHGKVSPAVFRSSAVGTTSNCAACHRDAAKGDFDEHAVRIPR